MTENPSNRLGESSRRYGLSAAPAGLDLVQNLINTKGRGGAEDLLATRVAGESWLRAAIAQVASNGLDSEGARHELHLGDLEEVRTLRVDLELWLSRPPSSVDLDTPAFSNEVRLVGGRDGRVRLIPSSGSSPTRLLTGAILSAILSAQQTGIRPRLKFCRNPDCTLCFYDRTKNNNGVWHDVHTCGNQHNLRVSRERRKARAESGDSRP